MLASISSGKGGNVGNRICSDLRQGIHSHNLAASRSSTEAPQPPLCWEPGKTIIFPSQTST